MRRVKYGSSYIEYCFQENESLKSHYVTVEKNKGVILKGKAVSEEKSDQLILKKAKWILHKLNLVSVKDDEKIVTGSRITYLGRSYYAEVVTADNLTDVQVEFNYSKFRIMVPAANTDQNLIKSAIDHFYREKAIEKITLRIKKFSKELNLPYAGLRYRKLEKSWGNCSPKDIITINPEAMKLPFSLIDYLIVHELCHIKIKDHSKQFWAQLSIHIPNWKELNERVEGVRL
jgi:predicted metal-dependent hydrolase